MTSSFACTLAFFNTSSRYVFALGRERILPRRSAAPIPCTRPRMSPARAVAATIAIWILLFYASDSSTDAALLKLATWTPIVGVFGLLLVQALTSFAIVRYFLVVAPEHGHVRQDVGGPACWAGRSCCSRPGCCSTTAARCRAPPGATFIRYGFWLIPIAFVDRRRNRPVVPARNADRYAAVGRFVHEDA